MTKSIRSTDFMLQEYTFIDTQSTMSAPVVLRLTESEYMGTMDGHFGHI